jgi:two-component system sensor histidine kinase MprB
VLLVVAVVSAVLYSSYAASLRSRVDAELVGAAQQAISTNLELLEDGAGLADPQAPALVRAAREQVSELSRLITDLLDLARYGESAAHREPVRLDLLTDEAVRRLRPGAHIDTDLRPCVVEVDPAAVDRAVSNLIDNATRWNPPDAAVRVIVDNGQVSVTDHGPGIADATSRTSSNASTGHPPPVACPVPGSAWPSWAESPKQTAQP